MSHRIALVAIVLTLGVGVGTATAVQPPGPTPPNDPLPGSCDLIEVHPTACLVYVVSCSPGAHEPAVCNTVQVSGPAQSDVRVLRLQLSRHYRAISLLCKTATRHAITCSALAETMTAVAGSRTVALRLPQSFTAVRVACRTNPSAGFSCKLVD